jgi:hypothetical protein
MPGKRARPVRAGGRRKRTRLAGTSSAAYRNDRARGHGRTRPHGNRSADWRQWSSGTSRPGWDPEAGPVASPRG